MIYSQWVRLDSRYPIVAALVLLVLAAIADAVGSANAANLLAIFVIFLLGAGVVLLILDHLRDAPRVLPPSQPTVAPDPVDPATQEGIGRDNTVYAEGR
jgi:hypothetical protein